MKKTVRILSLLMALMMVLGLASVFCATAGAEETTPSITMKSANLIYWDEISIRYCMETVGVNTADVKVYVWDNQADADAHKTETAAQTLDTTESDGKLYAVTAGIPAKNMADKQYVAANAGEVWSAVLTYSPADYAANITAKSESQAQKDAVAALMAYGAAAQTYFGYNTDALMNAGFLTVTDQKVYANDAYNTEIQPGENGLAAYSATMLFEGKISYVFKFTSTVEGDAEYFADCENYTTHQITRVMMTRDADGRYVAILPAVAVQDLDTVYSVVPGYLQNGVEIKGTGLKYSALHYAKRMAESATASANGKALAIAMANYYHYVNLALNGGETALSQTTISFATADQRVSQDDNQQVWANGPITLTNDKAGSTNNVADAVNPVKFYKGSTVTITGTGMTQIVFDCTGLENKYVTPFESIPGATRNGNIITVQLVSTNTFAFALSAQGRAMSMTVTYTITPCTGEHTLGDWTVTKDATCTEEGKKTAICTTCYAVVEEVIPATGHVMGEFRYDETEHWNVCENCDAEMEGTRAAHTFADGKCECGYEKGAALLTDPEQEKIVNAAYELAAGASMEGTQTLTGVISGITTAYNEQYKNITVVIVIGELTDKPITCYRMTGGEGLRVGDKITVTGQLKNFNGTIEFDTGCTYELVAADDTCEHIYNPGYEIKAPTCTEKGELIKTCYLCGKTEPEYLDMLPHSPAETWTHGTDTHWHVCLNGCETKLDEVAHTYENGACTVCGAQQGAVTVKKEITFELGTDGSASHKDGTSTSDYTETQDGYTLKLNNLANVYSGAFDAKGNGCLKLGTGKIAGSFTITIPSGVKTVKVYVAGYKTNAATVKVGDKTVVLTNKSDSGEYDVIEVNVAGLTEVGVTVTSGNRAMVNAIVFVVETSYVPCTEHTWDEGKITVPATCAKEGTLTITCTVCGETKEEVIAATGEHTWADVEVIEPTCTEQGLKDVKCTVCGKTDTLDIPATGHNISTEWTKDETGHWHACLNNCGEKKDFAAHTFDGDTCTVCGYIIACTEHTWTTEVTTPATCGANGVLTKTCSVCKATETETIPATGAHTPVWAYDADGHWHNCKVCGAEMIGDVLDEHTLVDGKCECGYSTLAKEEVTAEIAFTKSAMSNSKVSSYTATWTVADKNGITWTIQNFNNNNAGWDYIKAGRKGNASVATIVLPTENVTKLTKVEITIDAVTTANINSITLQVQDKDGNIVQTVATFNVEKGTVSVDLSQIDYEIPEGGRLAIVFDCASGSGNGLIQISKVTCYGYKKEA